MKKLVAGVLLTPFLSAGVCFAQRDKAPDPYQPILDRLESLQKVPLPEWRYHEDLAHPEDPSLNDADWPVVKTTEEWKTGARVLRRLIEIPKKLNGYAVRGMRVKLEVLFTSNDSMTITVFSNGSLVGRSDEDTQQPVLLTENAQPGQRFLIAVRVDNAPVGTQMYRSGLNLEAASTRPDPNILREEIVSVRPIAAAFPEGETEREAQMDASVKAIDFAALDRGDQSAFDESLRQAQAKLKVLDPWLKQFTIRAAGNSHIDMAWLWPWTETVEEVRNTFQSVLDLMREYPDFKFTMSSARTYEWMQEKYPDLFEQIRQRVKEGRWEVIGGMWVEPDLNMPDGESLVRQILVGQKYFQKNFGADIKIGWNPDSFGYNWQLPSIYGGKVTDSPQMLYLYGIGDHGGGPTRAMLDRANHLRDPNTVFPKIEFSTAKEFFADLTQELPNLKVPTWKDELYFEYHRGVMTTQADTKQRIRRDEELMLDAEKYASLASLFGRSYPQDQFELAWKNLLFDHFHDVMPGSGIAVNYLDAKRNMEDVARSAQEITDGALDELLAHVNTRGAKARGDGVPVVVFNSLSWPRAEVIEAQVQLSGPAREVQVLDGAGLRVEHQLLALDSSTNRARLLILADAPALGYRTYFVRAYSGRSAAKPGIAPNVINGHVRVVQASRETLRNAYIQIKVDPKTGCITNLFDLRTQTETLAPSETDSGGPKTSVCGNLLQAFRDKPKQWDAWNIDSDFEKEHWDLDKADEVKLVESGPLRAVIRVKKHFQNSTFVQDITMYAGVPRVDVKMQAEWH